MLKKMLMLGICMMFLTTSSLAFAQDVYVAGNGTKYHKEDCRFIQGKDIQKLTKDDAIAQGYTPCRKCYKEDLAASDSSASQQEKTASKKAAKNNNKS